ncbi:MAG TPA: hypothetical protein VNZ49_05925 [Bacteroidia bacterium]|jgi:hypothetical protein|nr:hypothetical protein [Bacteroidia bacterium]
MNQLFLHTLLNDNQKMLKHFCKIVAFSVRDQIEQFHIDHLSDAQMKELNPKIRNGIYDALFALTNYSKHKKAKDFVDLWNISIPDYWEDPKLCNELKKCLAESKKLKDIQFKSEFLNQQLRLNNIYPDEITRCIKIKTSFDFIEVSGDKHKHRNKISSQLRREGYYFIPGIDGYMKRTESILESFVFPK